MKVLTEPVVRLICAIFGGGPPTAPSDAATTATFRFESNAKCGLLVNVGSVNDTLRPNVFAATFVPKTNWWKSPPFKNPSTAELATPWFLLICSSNSFFWSGGVHDPVH